jgi:hypothetical protein
VALQGSQQRERTLGESCRGRGSHSPFLIERIIMEKLKTVVDYILTIFVALVAICVSIFILIFTVFMIMSFGDSIGWWHSPILWN